MNQRGRPPKKEEERKSIKYSIRLDIETEKRLVAYCEENGITKGQAIRQALILLLGE